jgi:response regulator RpfG family c-di-GMP phosphodiesterase
MYSTSEKLHLPKTLTITVVDQRFEDYADLQNDMREAAIRWKFVSTGHDALHLARIQPVDLWLINIQLPDMSGLDLCSMLKNQLDCVIYLVTDCYNEKFEREARIRGAAMFETKPVQAKWINHLLCVEN